MCVWGVCLRACVCVWRGWTCKRCVSGDSHKQTEWRSAGGSRNHRPCETERSENKESVETEIATSLSSFILFVCLFVFALKESKSRVLSARLHQEQEEGDDLQVKTSWFILLLEKFSLRTCTNANLQEGLGRQRARAVLILCTSLLICRRWDERVRSQVKGAKRGSNCLGCIHRVYDFAGVVAVLFVKPDLCNPCFHFFLWSLWSSHHHSESFQWVMFLIHIYISVLEHKKSFTP